MNRLDLFKTLLRDVSGTYVEIGTCWGGFAEFLLKNTPLTKLVCVDPYKVFPNDIYLDALNFQPQEDLDKKFDIVARRLLGNSEKREVLMARMTSYEASSVIEDNLSFVYIDGNHHHKEVLKDLVKWWPKLRKGGILAGDDVEDRNLPHTDGDMFLQHSEGSFGIYGVATALEDFRKVAPDFHYTLIGNQFVAYK